MPSVPSSSPRRELPNAVRCPTEQAGVACGSAVFYEWGLKLLSRVPAVGVTGEELPRISSLTMHQDVMVCARCNTPYVTEDGQLLDISAEIRPQEVQELIQSGQTTLPHPKVKDP